MMSSDGLGPNKHEIRRANAINYSRIAGESLSDYCKRARAVLEDLEGKCAVHIERGWFTHKLVGGCWICDTITFAHLVLRELDYWESQSRLEDARQSELDELSALDHQVPIGEVGPSELENTPSGDGGLK